MSNEEIALQLTLKAIDAGFIITKNVTSFCNDEELEDENKYNAKQVNDFFDSVLRNVRNS